MKESNSLNVFLFITTVSDLPVEKLINSILLQRFERFTSIFIAENLLKNLPSLNQATFKSNFLVYMETDEYFEFIRVIRERSYNFEQKPRYNYAPLAYLTASGAMNEIS